MSKNVNLMAYAWDSDSSPIGVQKERIKKKPKFSEFRSDDSRKFGKVNRSSRNFKHSYNEE